MYPTTKYTMSMIKQYLYELEAEEQYLQYLKYCEENRELFQQLPKKIEDMEEVEYE